MNVQALLHDSPPDQHRRPRNDPPPKDDTHPWPSYSLPPPQSPPRIQDYRPSYPPDPPIYHSPAHPSHHHPPPRRPQQPPSHSQPAHSPASSSHPSPAMASLRPIESPMQGQAASHTGAQPGPPPGQGVGLRMPIPTPLTTPSVTGPTIWGPDKTSGSDFLKERETPRDMRDWERDSRDSRDRARDLLRDRERPILHPPHPPPFADLPRKKNIAMEVNGPLAGPGVPVGPAMPGPDDLPSRSLTRERDRPDTGSSSRRPSTSNTPVDTNKKISSPADDELRGREQQRVQEIQLKERSIREPSRDREAWENDNERLLYQRARERKARERDAFNPYAMEHQTRTRPPQGHGPEYRPSAPSGMGMGAPSGPGIPPSGDYRGAPPPVDYRQSSSQPPPPPPHPSARDPGRTTPRAELVVLKHSNNTSGPGVPSERDRERGPLLNERDRERDREREFERMERERALHPPYGVIGDREREREREREWEREQERLNMGMAYAERDRDRGPAPGLGSVPPHASHPSLPPPSSLPLGHQGHSHSHSHSHGHSHHSHQHHHREQGGHSLHPVSVPHHHSSSHPPSSAPPQHQQHQQSPPQHKGPPHPHTHSNSRHTSHLVHHPQPQSSSQIQLLPHPQQRSHSHIPHSHPQSHSQGHSHGHPSQPPPHSSSSQPHSPHPNQMHGGPPPPPPPPPLSQSHPVYRTQPSSQPPSHPPAPGPSGSGMSPHHHHHHHHPAPPPQQPPHHHISGPPPPQRQFQNQFHTQFVPGLPQPGSRMGSPTPGPALHQQQPPPQQQRSQMQAQGVPPSGGIPSSSSQQQVPSSFSSKGVGLGLSGIPGLDPPEANVNVNGAKNGVPRSRKAKTGPADAERERDPVSGLERNGHRSYMDIDDMEGVEDPESDVDQDVMVEAEEWEEEREVKAKVKVNLGTFVYPKLPFPYFFDLGHGIKLRDRMCEIGGESKEKETDVKKETEKFDSPKSKEQGEKDKEGEKGATTDEEEVGQSDGKIAEKREETMDVDVKLKTEDVVAVKEDPALLDLETRATVIIPNRFIPLERPVRPKIWGGGLLDRVQMPFTGRDRGNARTIDVKRSRGGKRMPRKEGSTRQDDGKQVAVAQKRRRRIYTDDSDLFLCAIHSGWVTWTGAAEARLQGKDMELNLRVLRCSGAPGGAQLVEGVTGKEEVVGRFLGGWGEKCFNDTGKAKRRRQAEEKENEKQGNADPDVDEEDDGRGLVSGAWGPGHDGSAVEVLGVKFVERGTARTLPGLGLRNRAQRMCEYTEQRMNILGSSTTSNLCSTLTKLAGCKRRRGCDWTLSYPRRLPNATFLDVISEADEEERGLDVEWDYPDDERTHMDIHTIAFGPGQEGKVQAGFKYVPSILQELLFPGSAASESQPPKKRRKIEDLPDVEMQDTEANTQASHQPKPIVLLTASEKYLFLPCKNEQATRNCKYDLSLVTSQLGEGKESPVQSGSQGAKSPAPNPSTASFASEVQDFAADDGERGAEISIDPLQCHSKLITSLKVLKYGIGRASFRFLRDEVVIDGEEELRMRVLSWRWGAVPVPI